MDKDNHCVPNQIDQRNGQVDIRSSESDESLCSERFFQGIRMDQYKNHYVSNRLTILAESSFINKLFELKY